MDGAVVDLLRTCLSGIRKASVPSRACDVDTKVRNWLRTIRNDATVSDVVRIEHADVPYVQIMDWLLSQVPDRK